MTYTCFDEVKTNLFGSTLPISATSIPVAQRQTIELLTEPSKMVFMNPTFCYLVHSNPRNTYAELMKQAAVHAKVEYFNSKRGPANPSRSTFGDPPPASAPTPTKPHHSASAPDNQSTQHPKRKSP